jgi:hypothetical protein
MDMKPAPETAFQRIKGQFAPAYLTLSSIIQGVAFAFLAARVEATNAQYDATNWLLTAATFVGFLTVWNEYLMQVLAFVWVPTLLDSLVPFAFLASELFMAHFVYNTLRGWLLTLGLIFVVGGAAQILTLTQARSLADENRDITRVLAPHFWVRAGLGAVIVVLSLRAFALYDVLRLGQAQSVIALLAFALVIVFSSSSVPLWNQVLAYARGEHRDPPQRSIQ